jgi:hypothetical protein
MFTAADATEFPLRFVLLGLRPSADVLQLRDRVGRDGTNWDEHRGRGGGKRN